MKKYLVFGSAMLAMALSVAFAQAPAGSLNKGKGAAKKGVPTPRTSDGKVDLTGVYHAPGYGPGDVRGKEGFAHNIARDLKPEDVPMQQWAKDALHQRFDIDESRFDPEGFCLPMGTPRVNPYPWKIIQTDKLIVFLYEGNVHGYRQIFMDGRKHDPSVKESYWGDSIGHWEGETLVIDTVGLGFGDGRTNQAWLDADGHPRTSQLHVTERYTRPEKGKLVAEVTIDDPGAYTKPWKVTQTSQLAEGWEIMENICNENQDELGNQLDVLHLAGERKEH